ncbi:MAG: hypothetical protein GOV01_03045 [Candidatus Altiarchaeota archaeon]|nr:hypothetical protein [Candidatus Altiarchaeota archaeon]
MIILKHALANAHRYSKADFKAVAAKVFAEDPESRKNAKKIIPEIKNVVADVNKMTKEEITAKLEEIAPELLHRKKKDENKELPPLEGAENGKVRLRLPPEPNGYLHIGHALSFWLNYLYAKRYEGKLIMKLEDTNPTGEKKEYYDAILRDTKWIGIKWNELFILSEKMNEIEKAAEDLINFEKAYVCKCPEEKVRDRRMKLEADPCRTHNKQENRRLWREMFAGNKYTLRWKGDPAAKNSVMRDPTLYRVINKEHPHTKINHIAYPTYDLASAFTDGLLGITHVLRSEEFLMRAELHKAIIESLGMTAPNYVHFGRFDMEGSPTSKRFIKELIINGEVEGWDDPRLATIMALKRKGIVPKTFEDLAKTTGTRGGRRMISNKLLHGFNKKNIDPIAKRIFVITEPVELELKGEEMIVEMRSHPIQELGTREVSLGKRVFIEKDDYKESLLRLKGAYNIEIKGKTAHYAGSELIRPIVQWLSDPIDGILWRPGTVMKTKVSVDNKKPEPITEQDKDIGKNQVLVERGSFKEGEIVQMERIGFARIDSVKPLRLIYISN